ncbi:hypothetical protein [Aporhodopirellula aestuarii]|uniref:Secreted protein n=1 Tax=Aporhodopirellula aestuarii TaxID=2950107 RepID=A0ABT0U0W3_9BACT|nr:hypothetical protein [Aporhodopirellula aestuarii]MCM2370133.1 hypothetical protein [Aporhodopirellula aestuarii]
MNRKLAAGLLLINFTIVPLAGCSGHVSGVPEASQSERDKYKEMQSQAEAEAAKTVLEPNAG